MNRSAAISIAAAALLALGSGAAVAQGKGKGQSGAKNAGDPPHISTTGMAKRSDTAKTKGANNPEFCPPGQKKKPGKGSAFQC